MYEKFGQFIDGKWQKSEKNETYEVINPATEEIIGQLDDLLTIDVFMTSDPPVQIAPVSRDMNDFLDDVESSSNGMIKVARHYPDDDEKAFVKSKHAGISPME